MIQIIIYILAFIGLDGCLKSCSEEPIPENITSKSDKPWFLNYPEIETFASEHLPDIIANRNALIDLGAALEGKLNELVNVKGMLTDDKSINTINQKIRDLESKADNLRTDITSINNNIEQIYVEYVVSGIKNLDKKVEELKDYANKTYIESLKIKKDIDDL